uniref:Uncharacterized protein n=1 Tax=Arundo donax TaxID=35708 RepID=A0A0A8ZX89_ARUDO
MYNTTTHNHHPSQLCILVLTTKQALQLYHICKNHYCSHFYLYKLQTLQRDQL